MPSRVLPAMRFVGGLLRPACATNPCASASANAPPDPMVAEYVPSSVIPDRPLGIGVVVVSGNSVRPMMLPAMVVFSVPTTLMPSRTLPEMTLPSIRLSCAVQIQSTTITPAAPLPAGCRPSGVRPIRLGRTTSLESCPILTVAPPTNMPSSWWQLITLP